MIDYLSSGETVEWYNKDHGYYPGSIATGPGMIIGPEKIHLFAHFIISDSAMHAGVTKANLSTLATKANLSTFAYGKLMSSLDDQYDALIKARKLNPTVALRSDVTIDCQRNEDSNYVFLAYQVVIIGCQPPCQQYLDEIVGLISQTDSYSDPKTELTKIFAGLKEQVSCPNLKDEKGDRRCACLPLSTSDVGSRIVHLNDTCRWSREQIADWIDELDFDFSFPTPPTSYESDRMTSTDQQLGE